MIVFINLSSRYQRSDSLEGWGLSEVEHNSLIHDVLQLFAALHLEVPSIHELINLLLSELIDLWAGGLLESFPYPEFIVESVDLGEASVS